MCIFSHSAPTSGTYNQGIYFGACARCGRDLIRSGERWTPVPQGMRVAWRRAGEQAGAASYVPLRVRTSWAPDAIADATSVLFRGMFWMLVDAVADRRTRKILDEGVGRVVHLPAHPIR
jgi:hypothetical protein